MRNKPRSGSHVRPCSHCQTGFKPHQVAESLPIRRMLDYSYSLTAESITLQSGSHNLFTPQPALWVRNISNGVPDHSRAAPGTVSGRLQIHMFGNACSCASPIVLFLLSKLRTRKTRARVTSVLNVSEVITRDFKLQTNQLFNPEVDVE